MGTAMRVRHENSDTDTETVTETHPALADDTLLMPPPPPTAVDADDRDDLDRANASGDETAQATADDTDMNDETVTIQKVSLSDII